MLRSRLFQIFALIFILWSTTEVFSIRRRLLSADTTQLAATRHRMRVYVASVHWNNEEILRSHWNDGILHLAKEVGSENMFLSVFESGSWDGTKSALRDLDRALDALGVARNITMSEKTHHDETSAPPAEHGWIDTPPGPQGATTHTLSCRLAELVITAFVCTVGEWCCLRLDRLPNDVIFTCHDILRLIATNQAEYAAACSLDFSKPPSFYDTFALRNSYGQEHVMQTWPYFRYSVSRNAMTYMTPVPVASCWNGMVSLPASLFYADPPLKFRGVSDSLALAHVEGSECCLIHADNPLTKEKGVYLNPQVRVGYNPTAYSLVHPANRWVLTWQIFLSPTSLKEWVIRRRVQNWEAQDEGKELYEPGQFCLINEMQFIFGHCESPTTS